MFVRSEILISGVVIFVFIWAMFLIHELHIFSGLLQIAS